MQDLNSLPVKGELLRSQSVNVLLEMETTHLLAIFWLWTKSLPFVHSRGQITCEGGCGGTEQKNPGILLGMIKLFYILNGVAITWVYTFVKTKNEFYLMKLKNKKYFVISKV